MAGDPDYAAYCEELLQPVATPADPVEARRMFGGHGFFYGDTMFALIADETLYLRVDDQTRDAFDAAGCEQWVYDGKGRSQAMPYWTVPDGALEDPDELLPWARRAVEAALRNRKPKKPRKTAQRG